MLEITIPAREFYDEASGSFFYTKERTLTMEHSLVSLSKWESKWNKAFLSKTDKSTEETLDYFRCMTITKNVEPEVYKTLSFEQVDTINEYINAPMTATHLYEDKNGPMGRDTVTSELIYYWMIALNIPFECQKWHLNRLITLIKVCNAKSQSSKKMSKGEIMRRNASLNAARRKRLHTRG